MKIKAFLFTCVVVLGFSGCVSFLNTEKLALLNKAYPSDGRYEVVGEIYLLKHSINVCGIFLGGGIKYNDLLIAARDKYGKVDDVIGVTIDKETNGLIAVFRTDFIMRGIAIRYTDIAADGPKAAGTPAVE